MDWDKIQELEDLDSQFESERICVDSELQGAITEADAPTITVDATFILDSAITGGGVKMLFSQIRLQNKLLRFLIEKL